MFLLFAILFVSIAMAIGNRNSRRNLRGRRNTVSGTILNPNSDVQRTSRIDGVIMRSRIVPSQVRAARNDPFLAEQLQAFQGITTAFIKAVDFAIKKYVRDSILPEKEANVQIRSRMDLAMSSWRMYPLLNTYQRYTLFRWLHGTDRLPNVSGDFTGRSPVFSRAAGDEAFEINANEAPYVRLQAHFSDFMPSAQFTGARPGWVFKTGDRGLGYYRDTPPVVHRQQRQLQPTAMCAELIPRMRNRTSTGEAYIVNFHNDFANMPARVRSIYDLMLKEEDEYDLPVALLARCFNDVRECDATYIVANREYFSLSHCFKAGPAFFEQLDFLAWRSN